MRGPFIRTRNHGIIQQVLCQRGLRRIILSLTR
ncbi:hypothetical protein Gotri_020502 [Gossypium trilobum]|uniref:Uncharacterized protein n=1 Tax=Gossypium trilobum TaxID=34281 RepID=A0A7J9D9R2_9ROSI|nr:hypothetical protein [Gossypium trilobum]